MAIDDDADDAGLFRGHPLRMAILGLAFVLIGLVGLAYWLDARRFERTDDAYVEGNVVQISPQVAGIVTAVHVADNQLVQQGTLLFEIDPRDCEAAVAAAKAELDMALGQKQSAEAGIALAKVSAEGSVQEMANALEQARRALEQARAQAAANRSALGRAQANLRREEGLQQVGVVTVEQLEAPRVEVRNAATQAAVADRAVIAAEAQVQQAAARLEAAKAAALRLAAAEGARQVADGKVDQARAKLRRAELELARTRIYAPRPGRITNKMVQEGDQVRTDQVMTSLVTGMPWVTANFRETQLRRILPGQPVEIRIEAYPGHVLMGHVDSIQQGTGAHFRQRLSGDPGSGADRAAQRIPVKILFDEAPDNNQVLPLGLSVAPAIGVGMPSETSVSLR